MTPEQTAALLNLIADLRAANDRLAQENLALRRHLADHPPNQPQEAQDGETR